MSRSRAACALAAVLLSAPAAAQVRGTSEVQLSISASSGFTDNARNAPLDAPVGPEADVYFSVGPSVRYAREGRRLILTLSAGAGMSRYLDSSEVSSMEVNASTRLEALVSETLRASFALNASYADEPAIDPEGIVGEVPAGGAKLVTVGGGASLAKDLSPAWRLVDDLRLSVLVPVGDETVQRRGVTASNGFGAQYSFRRDVIDGRLNTSVSRYSGDADSGARTDYTVGATGAWFREIDRTWSTSLSAGATVTKAGDDTGLSPIARAVLARRGRLWVLTAAIGQSVRSNLLLSRTFSSSEATLSAAALLGERFNFSTSAGAAHSRSLDDSDEPAINSLRGSASLSYAVAAGFGLSLSYDVMYQVAGAAVAGGDATKLLRNNVVLSLTATWPTERRPRIASAETLLRTRESEELERAARDAGRED